MQNGYNALHICDKNVHEINFNKEKVMFEENQGILVQY